MRHVSEHRREVQQQQGDQQLGHTYRQPTEPVGKQARSRSWARDHKEGKPETNRIERGQNPQAQHRSPHGRSSTRESRGLNAPGLTSGPGDACETLSGKRSYEPAV